MVRIRLDPSRYELLEHLADGLDLSAEQLAGVWLGDDIDRAARRDAFIDAAGDLSSIRRHLERLVAEPRTSHAAGPKPRVSRRGGRRRAQNASPRGSLHGEIVNVLRQNGEPMTAAEIAEAIRQRGEYRAPRSGNPISGTAVSRRVANPFYRTLFERAGRRVGLASSPRRPSSS